MKALLYFMAALLIPYGGALACDDESPSKAKKGAGVFRVAGPFGDQVFVTPQGGRVTTSGGGVEVRIFTSSDDDLDVFYQGERVPPGRLVRDGSKVKVLDKNGKIVAELETFGDNKVVVPDGWILRAPPLAFNLKSKQQRAQLGPRPVIGIRTASVEPALAAHLKVDAEDVMLVSEVLGGMPAEQAGMQKYDIIFRINGKAPATLERLREALDKKKSGDEIRLSILRGGRDIDVTVGVTESMTLRQSGNLLPGMQRLGQAYEGYGVYSGPDFRGYPESVYRWYGLGKRDDSRAPEETAPEATDAPQPTPWGGFVLETTKAAEKDRLKKIEERLERLEELLEKLLEEDKRI
ncbi:MAG: PDZ domain-containing protein [Planctomycetota bacterium]